MIAIVALFAAIQSDPIAACDVAVHGDLARAAEACRAPAGYQGADLCREALQAGLIAGRIGERLAAGSQGELVDLFDAKLAECRDVSEPVEERVNRAAASPRSRRRPLAARAAVAAPRRRAAAVGGYFSSCAAARAAGAAPLRSGRPGYSRRLDRDGDGVACE